LKPLKKLSLPHLPKPAGLRETWKKLNEKEAAERALEPRRLRVITFTLTFATMILGLSFVPLFPQPLPVLLAFMVAAVTYGYPEVGMPIGCGIVGFGLVYQLSVLNFISMASDDPMVRGGLIVAWLVLFIVPPIIFHRQKAALAIDLGIMAAVLLFFESSYFMAVPLVLTAGVLFKRKAALTVLYTVLIYVPLLLLQYLQTILQVVRTDWWLDPTAVPAVYTPLSGIFKEIQNTSMVQFRLYDTNKIVTTITNQLFSNPPAGRLMLVDALKQYRDSLPGIMLFIAIVAALALAIFVIFKTLGGSSMEKILPVITATSAAALFFVCLNALQVPLAISGKADGGTAALAVVATVALTLPTSLITYSPKKKATDEMLLGKARELLDRLGTFEGNLNAVKSGIPVDVASVEGKMLVIKDKLEDVYAKASVRYYDATESDRKFDELNKGVSVEIEALFSELDVMLREYHTLVNCEYSMWVGKLRAVGLKVEPVAKIEFEKEVSIETRIERIKTILDAGRSMANGSIPVVEQVYSVVRSLYDPNLPEQSRAVAFAKEKLGGNMAPWVAVDALFVALNNWRRQYGAGMLKSVEYLRESLGYIARLDAHSEALLPALEDGNFAKITTLVKSAAGIEFGIEEKTLNVTEVTVIGNIFQSSLGIARDILLTFNEELLSKEKTIESLLPKPNYLWEKNITLKERMARAVEVVSDPQKYGYKETLESLPKFLSNMDECVATIVAYSERKELLLNYPTAQTAIENELGAKNRVSASDLPFDAKYSEEFLRLFYSHKYPEFSLDEENMVLARKA
jgi:hypothetical protein